MTRVSRRHTARNRRERGAQRIILALGAAVLGGMLAVAAAVVWQQPVPLTAAADAPADDDSPRRGTDDAIWFEMNDALSSGDRAAFLSAATGDGRQALARWWDNTRVLGWDIAAITPKWVAEDGSRATIILGAQLPFAPAPERGSGDPDAGLVQIQGTYYSVQLQGTGTERRITEISAMTRPEPWDEGELHVRRRDHVVLFAQADESALVDAQMEVAEQAAVRVLALASELGIEASVDGFVVGITDDADRMQRWQFGSAEVWAMNVAAFARPMVRPDQPRAWLDPRLAVGTTQASGTVIMLGPRSADDREQNLVHEYAHALLNAAYPSLRASPPASVTEGFARYIEWRSALTEATYATDRVKDAVARRGAAAFSNDELRGERSGTAYAAAASYYAFVADTGGDVWDLALDARADADGLVGFARRHPQFSISAWQTWVARQ